MTLASISWDIRALFSIWDPLSRAYSLFLLSAVMGMTVIPFQVLRWIRSAQSRAAEMAKVIQLRLEKLERNMLALFHLDVLFLCTCSCNELLLGIRSELSLFRNPNIDMVSPFDGLLAIVDLGFATLILIHCVRWWVSTQAARVRAIDNFQEGVTAS